MKHEKSTNKKTSFVDVMQGIGSRQSGWPAEMEQARLWYEPHLDRLHEDAETRKADLVQLEQIASGYPSRERFLTELTLDPPSASGALAGDPLLDEDYLVLSTVHSAKGQEWDAVYVLNVADGNFPNEYATGNDAAIDEERRLLYVAITRARNSLHLIEPQRYHVTQQPRYGDAYVHGARSRFLTEPVLRCLQRAGPPARESGSPAPASGEPSIDVAARLRSMW